MILSDFFKSIYVPQKRKLRSERSRAEYVSIIKTFERQLARPAVVEDLCDDTVSKYLFWLDETERRSPATVNKHRAHLLALWRFARKKKKLGGDEPDVEKTKEYKRIPEAWSLDEFQRLLTAAARIDGTILGIPAGNWWLALLLLMYDTGLRISAVMQLPAGAVTDGRLRVAAETQKQLAEQHFRLHGQTLDALNRMDGPRMAAGDQAKERLFPWPKDRRGGWRSLRSAYRKILIAAGLPHGPRDMFHKLRRTSATLLAAEVGEEAASKHLGHSGLDVTRRYLDPSKIEQKSAADVLPRPEIPNPHDQDGFEDRGR